MKYKMYDIEKEHETIEKFAYYLSHLFVFIGIWLVLIGTLLILLGLSNLTLLILLIAMGIIFILSSSIFRAFIRIYVHNSRMLLLINKKIGKNQT